MRLQSRSGRRRGSKAAARPDDVAMQGTGMRPTRKRKRRSNPHLVKIHRCYSVDGASQVCSVHPNTVLRWLNKGLATIDDKKPFLINGEVLQTFLESRQAKRKRPCAIGELYCLRCKAPKPPGGGMAEYRADNDTVGNLTAICPDCSALMNQLVNVAKLAHFMRVFEVTLTPAESHIDAIDQPSVNGDSKQELCKHE